MAAERLFVFCFALIVCATVSLGRPSDPQPVKTYDVDLTQHTSQRWNQVLDDHKELLPGVLDMVRSYIPEELLPIVQQIAVDIENLIPSPFAQEIIGIADYWGLDRGDVILMNILYDVTAFCTSIVAQDNNGTIWHARNLDYDNADLLRNLTVNIHYKQGNETLYSGVTYAGYVGILTGQRPNGFTITIDQRGSEKRRLSPWWENELTAILDKSSSFVSFLVRQTLENAKDFTDAVENLATTVIHATAYIIVGGANKGEGVVITRDRLSALDRYYLDPLQARWYVLETNYDRWTQPPPFDNQRRVVAHREMDKLGTGNINSTTLYNVLSTPPVMNNGTTYTTIMSASQPDVFNTHVRWPPL
ncbi:N-acylethanolamine-hydrolyzing acid amidase-like [Littorina saxatilis]|uniref:N-acylethanolamine-hydrolyzing acid amidase n=1 Tax=Littorina saxatilis TaxID=31220 RepID=A0AAN9AR52_9CAEN